MEDGEPLKSRREVRQTSDVTLHDDSSGVRPTAPVSPGPPQHDFDQRLHYRHIFKVQEGEALPERLRLVFALQSQAQSRVHAPQSILQPQQDVFGAEELRVWDADFHWTALGLAPGSVLRQLGSGAIRVPGETHCS